MSQLQELLSGLKNTEAAAGRRRWVEEEERRMGRETMKRELKDAFRYVLKRMKERNAPKYNISFQTDCMTQRARGS